MNPSLDTPTERIARVAAPDAEATGQRRPEGPSGGAGLRGMLGSMFWDVGLAVLSYYGARALGCSEYVALMAGTVVSGVRLALVALRDRRLDPFAMFLMVLFGAGLVLAFVTGDPRFVLLKDSFTTGLAGLLFVGSCLVHRPLTFFAAQRFAGPAGAERVRVLWADPKARRGFYLMSLVWGCGLLAEALLRIPLIYLLPLDVAVGASNVLMAVAYGVLIMFTVRFAKRARRHS